MRPHRTRAPAQCADTKDGGVAINSDDRKFFTFIPSVAGTKVDAEGVEFRPENESDSEVEAEKALKVYENIPDAPTPPSI